MLLACAAATLATATATAEDWPVLLPLLVAVFVACAFYGSLVPRSGAAVVELGTIYVAVVMLYLAFPLLSYLTNDLSFTSTNDGRLYVSSPSATEIGEIAWLYAVHLLGFAVAYRALRGGASFVPRLPRPGSLRLALLLGLLLAIFAFFWVLGFAYDLTAGSYIESYLVSARLPLLLAQLANHLGGMRLVLEIALLVLLCADFPRYRGLLFVLLVAIGATTFVKLGSRTEFVLGFGGAVLAYHWLVRRLAMRWLAIGGSVLVALFLVAGALRDGTLGGDRQGVWNPLAHASEFETLFANAYDLERRQDEGELDRVPPRLLLFDVLAFVPQQLSPVQKVSPSIWYVSEFYPEYAALGGTFAFGTISEAVVGGGVPGLVARASLLGAALALLHRWAVRRRRQFWPVVIYVWAAVNVYQCFRATTFYPGVLFLYRVLPIIVVVTLLEQVVMQPRRVRRRALDARSSHVPPGVLQSRP